MFVVAVLLVTVGFAASSSAATTGHISGKVTADRSVAGVTLSFVTDLDGGDFLDEVSIDSTGNFGIDLAPGTYYMCASGEEFTHQCYGQVGNDNSTGTPIVVSANSSKSVNFALVARGAITGTVLDVNGQPAAGLSVQIYEQDGDSGEWFNSSYDLYTSNNGTYRAPVDPGQYKVGFGDDEQWSEESTAQPEFYNNVHTLDQAQILTLTNSQTLTGIGGRLDKGASITGNVTGPVVDDPENLSVYAYQLVDGEWTEVKWGTINSSGTYTLPGLITGSYRVCAAYTDVEWQPACFGAPRVKNAQDVAVVAPNVSSGKNIALVRSGWISGKVVDATGNGLGGISVSAEPVSDDDESDEGGSSTDDSGEYKVFVGAGTYKLSFSDENEDWAPEYYNDKPTAATADALTVVDSAGTTANNTVMAPAASIAGTVTTATANTGGHVFSACARNTTTGDEWCDSVDESTGAYNIKGLPAGNTLVRFYGEGPFASEYYSNVREAANASPTPIALTAGQQRTAINATLEIGGTITGKIVYPDGTPAFEGCHIDAWGSTDDAWGEPTLSRSHAHARSDGTFTLEGLSTGSYVLVVGRIRADDGACDPVDDERWYDGDEVLSPQESSAQTFSAVFAQTKSIGTLVYGDPTPLQNTAKPTVPTAPQVGVVATAGDGSWSPAATSFSYVWQADGVTIPGAVSKSYTPGADQAGKKLSVIVTAHRSGSSDGVATSLQSAVVKNGVLTKGTPTISGPPAVGSKLTAGPGVWSPAGVQFAYQWLAQGNIITNATGSTFTPTASEIGQQISVRVTGSRTGYDAANATSAATAAVIDPNAVPTQTAPSAPRIRTAYAGGAGKPIQARATWYAPLSNGGAAIKTYRIVALKYNSSGAIVQRYYATRGATIRSHTFTVPAGRYGFRVQANNDVGASPWSAKSNTVSSR